MLVIFPFSIIIILESPCLSMLVGKVWFTLIPKRFWIFWCIYIAKITKLLISIRLYHQISLFLIFSNIILKFSSIWFVFKFRALHNDFTKILLNMRFMMSIPCRTLVFPGAWASKKFPNSFSKFSECFGNFSSLFSGSIRKCISLKFL